MPLFFAMLMTTLLTSCGTYQGNEQWRRSACNELVNSDERAQCEEEAGRSESEYKQDVEEALTN
ncbi:hypothetical protein [Granulosicoccus antarcticus]|uniref:Uncharacterized protein n=1 Tax=Granulosicoccus antarcticus IMCC3135 TaxID=1192854 RepID=A0A2Z2NK95_9GAMM|nr:hypothetical protein [Granulosicoccus antarcticus]ASJ70298.1 hypothetical protein IMCC3135_00860 [Granulosicoccus antarcticus IMCC3135]